MARAEHAPERQVVRFDRPSRRFLRPGATDGQGGPEQGPGPASPLAAALATVAAVLWFGLAAGLVETACQSARLAWFDAGASLTGLKMNRHAVWMIPASSALLFALAAPPLGLLAAVLRGEKARRLIPFVPALLAAYSIVQVLPGVAPAAGLVLACGLGVAIGRKVAAREAGFRRLVRASLAPLALGAVGLGVGSWWLDGHRERAALAALPAPRPGAPNVLWIILDTVRADRTSLHGHARDTTPNLARLADRGIVFDEARAPAGWTLPSHASMFTGRYPRQLARAANVAKGYPPRRLDERHDTVAERLGRGGYATAGFVANTYFCNAWYGLAQGFARYEDAPVDLRTILRSAGLGRRVAELVGNPPHERADAPTSRKSAATINHELLAWLDSRPDAAGPQARPFFAFLNYFDAHDPYMLAHAPHTCYDPAPASDDDRRLLRDWHERDKAKVSPAQVEMTRAAYDTCLADLDRQLGQLLDELERRGVLDSTWIIVASDHGELFGEHGRFMHGPDLHRAATHVPLVVVPPGGRPAGAPARVSTPVSLRDLAATVVDLAGVPAAPGTEPLPGRSLARFWTAGGDTSPDPVYSETGGRPDPAGTKQVPVSVVAEGFQYLRGGDGREELYALTDRAEAHDLAADPSAADTLARLRDLVREFESQPAAE